MGILNVTPDSFADGGLHFDVERAVAGGPADGGDGADIIDVGGESTRPGADPLPAEEEMRRVLPVVERLAAETSIPLSIDTYKAVVAREAVARGAAIVNDVSGLQYDRSWAGRRGRDGAAIVLMHTRGRSRDMYERAVYGRPARDVAAELAEALDAGRTRRRRARRHHRRPRAWVREASRTQLSMCSRGSDRIAALGRPILCGASRKSFLKAALANARRTSASGERPRRSLPASCSAPTSCASTMSEP